MSINDWMIEDITKEVVLLLIRDYKVDVSAAFDMFYNSATFSALTNFDNGLYTQSTAYIYEYLQNELATGRMA